MGILSIISLIGLILTIFLLPETKRKDLGETSGEARYIK
jgi:hypothetical protein